MGSESRVQLEGPTAAGLMYSDTGGDGPVVVLLHGVLMNGSLWDEVVDGLRDRYRCIVPELPFGAHRTPMPDEAELDLESLAKMVAEFLAELDLHDVTLVCNDWGGAQLVVRPGGIGSGGEPGLGLPARRSTTTHRGCLAACCASTPLCRVARS